MESTREVGPAVVRSVNLAETESLGERGRCQVDACERFVLNATNRSEVKSDYDTIVAPAGRDGRGLAIYTFGGDRETFDFFDPTQWPHVDNDVWRYSLPKNSK